MDEVTQNINSISTSNVTSGGFGNTQKWQNANKIELCFVTELCHPKPGLKIFIIVILNEGLAGTNAPKPSFGMTLTYRIAKN